MDRRAHAGWALRRFGGDQVVVAAWLLSTRSLPGRRPCPCHTSANPRILRACAADSRRGGAGECLEEAADDASGQGARTLDGGDSCFDPEDHRRRRAEAGSKGRAEARRAAASGRESAAATAAKAGTCAAASAAMKQDDIDAMLAGLDEPEPAPPPRAERPVGRGRARTHRGDAGAAVLPQDRRDAGRRVRRAGRATASPPSRRAPRLRRRRRRSCRPRPQPRSIPRSMRSPKPCWCRTPRRSRIW